MSGQITNMWLLQTQPIVMDMGKSYTYQQPRSRIQCKDGFEMSIQAGARVYCEPQINGAKWYDSVEIGYPNMKEELLPEQEVQDVWGYVPVELVDKIILKHGDIANPPKEEAKDGYK